MAAALYGEGGFYRSSGAPGRHFRTSAHTGPAWSAAIARLVQRLDEALGYPDQLTVADMGAGRGELLAGLAAGAPARWELVGVDVAPRPAALPDRVDWRSELPTDIVGLLIAVEWLDVVPVDVVELADDGPRIVEVDARGDDRLGGSVSPETADWLTRWWPLSEIGDRAEVGRSRDEAWRDAVARLRAGVAVAVDYAAVPARDLAGTLTGYRSGRQVMPVPDGSMDITAHVLFESLLAGSLAVDTETMLRSQRDVLRELGLRGARPSYDGEASSYLTRLSRAGEEAELLDPGGLGAFMWLVVAKGLPMSSVLAAHPTMRGTPNATSVTPSE
jgi:SAM-dependent MidA family methyltransferase